MNAENEVCQDPKRGLSYFYHCHIPKSEALSRTHWRHRSYHSVYSTNKSYATPSLPCTYGRAQRQPTSLFLPTSFDDRSQPLPSQSRCPFGGRSPNVASRVPVYVWLTKAQLATLSNLSLSYQMSLLATLSPSLIHSENRPMNLESRIEPRLPPLTIFDFCTFAVVQYCTMLATVEASWTNPL